MSNQTKEQNAKKNDQKNEKKLRQKETEEERLKKIDLQQSEKLRLNYVFNKLCTLEEEKSSDDDSKNKKYYRNINAKAEQKRMKFPKSKFKGKLEKATLEMEVKNRIATINKLTKEMNREWKKS